MRREAVCADATRRACLAALGAAATVATGLTAAAAGPATTRPLRPDAIPGVDNLYQVAPGLYRSAQPTVQGFRELASSLNIHTIVNLREFHDDAPLAAGLSFELPHIGTNTWHVGDDNGEKVVRALAAVREGQAK